MPTLIAGIVVLILAYVLLNAFRAADPRLLARLLKSIGGILALAFAAYIGARGQLAVAVPIGLFGLGLLGWAPFSTSPFGRRARTSGQRSRVRTAFLDMELDHDSGAMTGTILRGPQAGRTLETFSLEELAALHAQFDADSRALLESYLDRRFAGWRAHVHADTAAGAGGGAAGRGKMTEEEAYQILGLQPGAGRDDISRAHRSLMKKLHPDQGGSTYLAARVNEAKDLLIRTHRN